MYVQRMLSQSNRVRNRILSWINGTNFDPRKLRGVILGMIVNITVGEICCYRFIQQDIRAGELPSYTADFMIVIFGVFEAVVAPIVSWWGYTKRRKLLIGYTTAVIVCFLSWFLLPAKLERKESELCDAANSENNIEFIGTSTRTVLRLVMIIYSCILFVIARVVFFSHTIAYSDEYAPARTSMHYGALLMSRIFPLVLGYKILTGVVENNLLIQIIILLIGSLVSFVQLPNAIPNKPPVVEGVQMEALPSKDRGLCTSIKRVMNSPIALTQMFSMGLVSASLWGYGYYELDIIKAKFNMLPSSSGYLNFSKILLHYFILAVIAYFGAIFSDPILKKFCQIKTLKQAAAMSVLMFVFYIVITTVPRCNTDNVVGIGRNYYSHPECSLACNCKPQWAEFKPVCAVDDLVSYVSPCQAGCRGSQEINGIQVYSNCTCAGGGRVLERACGDEPCRNASLLHELMFYILFTLGILTLQAQGVLLLKVVDPRDKSVAQGMAFSFIAILTFVVGHTIFYGLYVSTCRWFEGNKCHLQSAAFPYLIGATCAFLMLTSIMTAVTSRNFFKKSKEDNNEINETRLYGSPGLPIAPHCSHNSKAFQCNSLKSNDFFYFHKSFYSNKTKQQQDNMLIKHCNATSTSRKRPTTSTRAPKTLTLKYFIPRYKNGKLIPVCRETFLNILRLKKGRVQGVMKRYFGTQQSATERRGGNRKKHLYASKREAVQNFIKKFKPLEIHYSREKHTNRLYLHPDLNIHKMWVMYNDQAQPDFGVTLGFFRLVFNTSFNIGFGSPREDVCSTCLQFSETLKIEKDSAKKVNIMTQARIHKLRAAAFFSNLKEERDDLLVLSFDCQKNLPLPKIPDQATYYARQLYIYNFTVVIGSSSQKLTKENVHAYTWTENESLKGSNEICSCLFNCLNNIDLTGKTVVRMVADGCGGQNKNMMVLGMTMKWLVDAPENIKTVEIIYPVTGHSFLPPDRVFAFTEKKIRKLEIIVHPDEYRAIFLNYATVHNLASDIPVLDWKESCKDILKPTQSWHFQISKCKRIILTRNRNTVLVRGEISYKNDLSASKSILKKGKLGVSIKPAKLNDVKRLLEKHYGEHWQNRYEKLNFYKFVLNNEFENLRNEEENDVSYTEEVLDFV